MTTILRAVDDRNLFGQALRGDPASWAAWRAFLAALFALPMSEAEAALYRQCTGRSEAPSEPFNEAWLVCGRRAGKSFVLALIAVFLACFKKYADYMALGERVTIVIVATDKKQARVIFRFCRGLLKIPMLRHRIEREASDAIDLTNGVSIEIMQASFRSTRGYALAACLCDELAFWRTDDAAQPDYAILDALRPSLGTIPGAMLLCASSPHAQSGALFDAFRKYHGRDDADVLVWRAPTRLMNPTYPQRIIDAALERDPADASSQYLAEFRTDVEAFVSREAVEACVSRNVIERKPIENIRYVAFVDPSGGSSDAFTLAIAHAEQDICVIDAVRERRPPFSPEAVVAEFAALLKQYRVGTVRGDRYAGDWPKEAFARHGVTYVTSSKVKNEIYIDALPLLNSRRVDLVDNARLVAQLIGLERRVGRGGRDTIDHRPGAHDDLCNVALGAALATIDRRQPFAPIAPIYLKAPGLYPSPVVGVGAFDVGGGVDPYAASLGLNRDEWPTY